MRKVQSGLSGAPAALALGAALGAALFAVWIATRLAADWVGLSGRWTWVLVTLALLLTVVSFPVWFSFALLIGYSVAPRLRRPRARNQLSKMADELGIRAGTVVREVWGGDGVFAGDFELSILVLLPGSPEEAVQAIAHRALDAGYGEPWSPSVRREVVRGVPRWAVTTPASWQLENSPIPVPLGWTLLWVTLTEAPR